MTSDNLSDGLKSILDRGSQKPRRCPAIRCTINLLERGYVAAGMSQISRPGYRGNLLRRRARAPARYRRHYLLMFLNIDIDTVNTH